MAVVIGKGGVPVDASSYLTALTDSTSCGVWGRDTALAIVVEAMLFFVAMYLQVVGIGSGF